MKKIMYVLGIILLVGVGILFFKNKPDSSKKDSDIEDKIQMSPDVMPISEVSKNALSDMQEAGKTSTKLNFNNIIPYCPDVKSVADIHYINYSLTGDFFKGITNEKDMLELQFEVIGKLLNKDYEELKIECFESGYYNLAEKGDYTSFEEFMNDEENEKREPKWLAYCEHTEDYLEVSEFPAEGNRISFNKGKCYELNYENRMNVSDGITTATEPDTVCEMVAEYYVYEENDRLEEKWKLLDGEMSVKEGIELAETYVNNIIELDGDYENVSLKVANVEVYKIDENLYCYRYGIRKSIANVLFRYFSGGSIAAMDLDTDSSYLYQVEKDEFDIYEGSTRRVKYENINESSSIIPLGKAIELLETNLGNNSQYQVEAVELGYLALYEDYMTQAEGNATVCWYFKCINELDKCITEFYVNAFTGEVKTYTRHQ